MNHTPAPWRWWTSNSWRRLKHDNRGTTQNVLEPYVCSDGIADLLISEADMALIAAAPDFANAALLALSALKNADEGDPTNETGWASDESCEAYCALWKALEKAGIDPRTTNPVKQIEERAS